MASFFKSFFLGKTETPEEAKAKNEKKNFDILKFDGLRAQRMGRTDYALSCFTQALAIEKEFETMSYLAQLYTQLSELEKAREILEEMAQMEPEIISTFFQLTHVCYMQEDYAAMKTNAQKAVELEKENATAYLWLAKAEHGLKDQMNTIAHLTQAIALKEDYTEALLQRAEELLSMQVYKEASEDIETILQQSPDDEAALLLKGRWAEATHQIAAAEESYKQVSELNPFNEQAYLLLGKLYISQKKLVEAIATFDEAIELNPNFAAAYHERGRAKLLNGDKEGSVEDMKKSLELNPREEAALSGQFDNQGEKFDNVLGFVH